MLVGKIADQLGNQMFTYASLKTIAKDRKEDFYFIRAHNDRINDSDKRYGNEIHTMFPNIQGEFLEELPKEVTHTYHEPPIVERKTNYQKEALQVPENTLMLGHFISCQYFVHRIQEVWDWFAFPEDVEVQVQEEFQKLCKDYPDRLLVSVHFRVGEDYVRQGFRIRDAYWLKAAKYLTQKSAKKPLFLVFYDKKAKIVEKFTNTYECVVCRGSLLHDLCMMSKCEKQIISNSSFAIMSAVLNQRENVEIIRPSAYPVGQYFQPQDCFMESWTIIEAHQSIRSKGKYWWMRAKGRLLKLIRNR